MPPKITTSLNLDVISCLYITMASGGYSTATRSNSGHDNVNLAPARFGELVSSTSSHSSGGHDDYRVLQPGDFTRARGHRTLRSRPASRIDYGCDSEIPSRATSNSNPVSSSHESSCLPPDFDLVVQSQPNDLDDHERRDSETLGSLDDESEASEEEVTTLALTECKEELVSVADETSDSDSLLAANASSQQNARQRAADNAHLFQLKQEAEEAWANYRPGMTPQQHTLALDTDLEIASTHSDQPAHIPPRVTSLRRSSLVALSALPTNSSSHRRGSVATASNHSHTSSVHDKATSSSQHARPEYESFPRITTPLSHGSAASWRGVPSSDGHFHRPYTASILSSTSEGSFLSYQNSFESGMSPLLLSRSAVSSRPRGEFQRPATAGSIPTTAVAPYSFSNYSRPLHAGPGNRPETSNQLSAEERRQHVRRTKKLTQMLGEEMLFATNAPGIGSSLPQQPHSSGPSGDNRRRKYRPHSLPFNNDVQAAAAVAPAGGSTAGNKTRTISRKLLRTRTHGVKSLDHAFFDFSQPPATAPVQGLNRKAAAILGLPHPYSSSALTRTTGQDTVGSEEEVDVVEEINCSTCPLFPSGLEEFNEPTPKVAQLAAFSAAALDEGGSPTLPQDGPFHPFDRSHLDQALALSESRKLAAAREERRRRVAKMSRWLGEAVPAELIQSGTRQSQGAVIRSTGMRNSLHQSSASHDSTGYTASEVGSTRRPPTSSLGHGSVSHEGSVASNLQSFMSIDSSDEDESDTDAEAAGPVSSRSAMEPRAVAPSHLISGGILPGAASDSLSTYRTSIDSYEYLLENDHERLTELASIFHGTRMVAGSATASTATVSPMTRAPRSLARPHTLPATGPIRRSVPVPQPLATANQSPTTRSRPLTLPASAGGLPRRSAAFLELSDSESDSSEPEDDLDYDPAYFASSTTTTAARRERSISKLSNFFGSTPPPSHLAAVRGDALKTMLRSLEQEAMDDGRLTSFQKSEIRRKVHALRRRTTRMFA